MACRDGAPIRLRVLPSGSCNPSIATSFVLLLPPSVFVHIVRFQDTGCHETAQYAGKSVHKLIAQATCNERAKIWFGCPGWEPCGSENWKKSRKRLVHFCQRLMSKTTTLAWHVRDSGAKFFWRSLLGVSDAHLHGVTKSGIGAARKLLQSVLQTKRGTRRIPENQIEGPVGSQPGWRPLNGRIFSPCTVSSIPLH